MTDRQLVFISYSHKDLEWKNRFRPHLDLFSFETDLTIWDDRQIEPTAEWYDEIQGVMRRATVAVCLISSDYLASEFCIKEEIPYLLERHQRNKLHVAPVLLRSCAWRALPWLASRQLLPRDNEPIASRENGDWDTPFAEIAAHIHEVLKAKRSASSSPPDVRHKGHPEPVKLSGDRMSLDRLPATGAELFGRQLELERLDEAWVHEHTNLIALVGWGGIGKSTLINRWLEQFGADGYRDATRVFAWSFYSQGTNERITVGIRREPPGVYALSVADCAYG